MTESTADVLARIAATIESRKGADPAQSYVAALLNKGEDAVLKVLGETTLRDIVQRRRQRIRASRR